MLRARIIPCLLICEGGLVKTVCFDNPRYIGDPINAVRIFNEKEADEIIILDIDASKKSLGPNFGLIAKIAAEAQMPVCYGGGITSVAEMAEIISLGVEKVAVGKQLHRDTSFIKEAVSIFGSQSIVAIVNVLKNSSKNLYEVFDQSNDNLPETDPIIFCKTLQDLGVGEIVLNNVTRDGQMCGYDISMVEALFNHVDVPITALGGAGKYEDLSLLVSKFSVIGAAAGSLFVFKGKHRAVLINYPNKTQKLQIFSEAGQ